MCLSSIYLDLVFICLLEIVHDRLSFSRKTSASGKYSVEYDSKCELRGKLFIHSPLVARNSLNSSKNRTYSLQSD